MMGKQSGQIQMVILDIDSMIPEDHLLRRIKKEMLTKSRQISAIARFLCRKTESEMGNRCYRNKPV